MKSIFPKEAHEDTQSEAVDVDINRLLIPHPAATFFFRFSGFGGVRMDVGPDDLLIVDRAGDFSGGSLLLVECDGEWAICTGSEFISSADRVRVWGVVSWILHRP